MRSISTAPYHGSQVVFSPYSPHRLAFTGAKNYGIAGSGVLVLYEESPKGVREVKRFDWPHPLNDVTWSELNEMVLVVAGGDGNVIIVDVTQGQPTVLQGHTADVSSVQWSVTRQEQLVLSASWDHTVRIWDPQSLTCVSSFTDHTKLVYQAAWSPLLPHTFASVSGDETLRISDSSHPPHSTSCVNTHSGEVLACDWSKYDQYMIFTAGVDTAIKGWDIRQLTGPVLAMSGHTRAIKRLKCDPFHSNIVASCSYDFTVRLWDVGQQVSPLRDTIAHHTEFTTGLDFCSLLAGQIADCSWDRTIKIYSPSFLSQWN